MFLERVPKAQPTLILRTSQFQAWAGRVVDVDVTLHDFTHTHPADVDILLVSPEGTASILMSDQGGGGDLTDVHAHL